MKDRRCWATGKRQFKNQADAALRRRAVPDLYGQLGLPMPDATTATEG